MELLKQKNIPLEVCPYSNYLTQAFPTFESHPFQQLLQAGVPLTVNSDDPGVFASVLSDDLQILVEHQNLQLSDLQKLQAKAFEVSFIPTSKKQKFAGIFGV